MYLPWFLNKRDTTCLVIFEDVPHNDELTPHKSDIQTQGVAVISHRRQGEIWRTGTSQSFSNDGFDRRRTWKKNAFNGMCVI